MFKRLLTRQFTLRQRLIVSYGLVLLVCQTISALWLWHESKEQIQLLVQGILEDHNNHRHVMRELHEGVASLVFPSLIMMALTLALCYQAVKRIMQPLADLQKELEARTEDNLKPVTVQSRTAEIDAVSSAINKLVARLNSTLENERLFTADVAHELRTPLAGVRLHLELLAQSEKINVDPLIARLDQMMDSVSHLLQLARVGQSFSAGNYQTVMLNRDVIMPLHDALKEMAATRGQTLVVHALSQDSAVRGDATLLRVMLRNLVENAHRYSPENSTLTVTALAGEEPVLMVEDEGVGIDESRAEKLSEAFVRMDSRYGGLGLGLSIVSRICLLHHARFTLQNRQNRSGTRACVVFEGSE